MHTTRKLILLDEDLVTLRTALVTRAVPREYMATLSWFATKASSFFLALGTAVDLGEFLAIFGTFAPAAGLARFVTRSPTRMSSVM